MGTPDEHSVDTIQATRTSLLLMKNVVETYLLSFNHSVVNHDVVKLRSVTHLYVVTHDKRMYTLWNAIGNIVSGIPNENEALNMDF